MSCVGCRVGAADDSPLIGLPEPGDRAEGTGVSGDGASCSGGILGRMGVRKSCVWGSLRSFFCFF